MGPWTTDDAADEGQSILSQSEDRLRMALAGADLGMWDWNILSDTTVFNARWASMLGFRLEEIQQSTSFWEDRIHPEDHPRVMRTLSDHLEGRTPGYEAEYRLRHKLGTWVWVLARGRVIQRDGNGKPVRLCGTHLDVTDRKRAEGELRRSEAMYRALLEGIPDTVARFDREGRHLFLSRGATDLPPGPAERAVGRTHRELGCSEAVCGFWEQSLEKCFRTGALLEEERSIDVGGEARRINTRFTPERDAQGRVQSVLCLGRDVTAQRRAEDERVKLQGQLMQAQKMESIGQLAGGVAHDFNNMLGVILGHTTMALESVHRGHPLHGTLTEIHKAAQRSAELTRQLLAFARKQNVTPKVVDLNTTVGATLTFLQRLIGEDIRLEWVPSAGLWPVRIDPTQIDQVLANLCANSRDAISGGGRVTIEAANVAIEAPYCRQHPGCAPGEYVSLSVSDTGLGMSPEIQAHLFEPFFTSKGLGKGTGLGLATVYGIVRQNNGFINVYSEVGKGTTFRICLPRWAGSGAAVRHRRPSAAPRGGGETLLLVEDEPSILKMAVMMLKGLGYTVLSAASPEEALRVADELNGAIHLLISDVVMPGMDGLELTRRLKSRFPGVRVMLMSGYTANVIARHGALDKDTSFVAKPFSVHELAAKVREALEEEIAADAGTTTAAGNGPAASASA